MRYSETNIKNILDKFKIKDLDNLYKFIGCGKILPNKIVSSMFPEKKLKKNDKIVIFNTLKEKNRSDDFPLIVHGLTQA